MAKAGYGKELKPSVSTALPSTANTTKKENLDVYAVGASSQAPTGPTQACLWPAPHPYSFAVVPEGRKT
jgi:hypothetical protein